MYALHSFYKLAHSEGKKQQKAKNALELGALNKALNKRLPDCFNSSDELFEKTEFKCVYPPKQWLERLKCDGVPDVFLMPAERSAAQLFFRELGGKPDTLARDAFRENGDARHFLKDVFSSQYARVLADYIDWLNNMADEKKSKKSTSKEFHREASFVQRQLAQGRYAVNSRTGEITYKPKNGGQGESNRAWGLHVASSTAKSLFSLWFYLEHQAQAGDVLMIDEPELNIHPGNQLLIAHLLARLVNMGINVVISTHSDYIVYEICSLMMLSEDESGKLMRDLNKSKPLVKYEKNAILTEEQVGMYLFDNNAIEPYIYKKGEGFAVTTFNDVIANQNKTGLDIYHGLLAMGEDK